MKVSVLSKERFNYKGGTPKNSFQMSSQKVKTDTVENLRFSHSSLRSNSSLETPQHYKIAGTLIIRPDPCYVTEIGVLTSNCPYACWHVVQQRNH